ncbi:hypothetical protein [Tranquillimonas alkanivorans]|uniref:TrbL/VirB6 plasmid conjugal transfer protein n=1 Tax=Tranquillimonas alkanivorans TaxID=441119 RepID=A0A1I5V346_9RHOB|nr:hypothetical protein [Tranquillimonas alkanivorans]SFQ01376.1 hypothetical protein SAMN04488047_12618 [Tranquillimonas alkanivorans]
MIRPALLPRMLLVLRSLAVIALLAFCGSLPAAEPAFAQTGGIFDLPDELPEPPAEMSAAERMVRTTIGEAINITGGTDGLLYEAAEFGAAGFDWVFGTEKAKQARESYDFWSTRASGGTGVPDPNTESDVLRFFNYATGASGHGCYTCSFTAFITLSLGLASEAVFEFWSGLSLALIGGIFGLYALYQIGRILLAGDEATPGDLFSMLAKRAIATSIVVTLLMGAAILPNSDKTLWDATGPQVLEVSFGLGNEVREGANGVLVAAVNGYEAPPDQLSPEWRSLIETYLVQRRTFGEEREGHIKIIGIPLRTSYFQGFTTDISEVEATWLSLDTETRQALIHAYVMYANTEYDTNDPTLGCGRTHLNAIARYAESEGISDPEADPRTSFIDDMVMVGCIVERVHAMGIAAGAATIFAQEKDYEDDYKIVAKMKNLTNWISVEGFVSTIIRIVIGSLLVYVFALSAVRMIFMLVDIALRVFVVAAFSPVLAVSAIFPGTRRYAASAFRIALGAMAAGVTMAILNLLILVLLTQIVPFFNTFVGTDAYPEGEAIASPTSMSGFKMFLMRVLGADGLMFKSIPMDATSPWLLALLFVGITASATSKKIEVMVQQFVGASGDSPLADKAVQTTTSALGFAKKSGTILATTAISAVPVAGPMISGAFTLGSKSIGAVGAEMPALAKVVKGAASRLKVTPEG